MGRRAAPHSCPRRDLIMGVGGWLPFASPCSVQRGQSKDGAVIHRGQDGFRKGGARALTLGPPVFSHSQEHRGVRGSKGVVGVQLRKELHGGARRCRCRRPCPDGSLEGPLLCSDCGGTAFARMTPVSASSDAGSGGPPSVGMRAQASRNANLVGKEACGCLQTRACRPATHIHAICMHLAQPSQAARPRAWHPTPLTQP